MAVFYFGMLCRQPVWSLFWSPFHTTGPLSPFLLCSLSPCSRPMRLGLVYLASVHQLTYNYQPMQLCWHLALFHHSACSMWFDKSNSWWPRRRWVDNIKVKCKSKDVFLLHAGVKWQRRHSSYTFLTSALYGGKWSVSRSGRALSPGKDQHYPLNRMLDEPQIWSGHRGWRKNPLPPPGNPDLPVCSQTL
jgi:hypothetical protein